jgi:rhodanese-related sulfurtransferase
MKIFFQCCLFIVAAVVAGGIANSVGPFKIPWVEDYGIEKKMAALGVKAVDIARVEAMISLDNPEDYMVILDARKPVEFKAGHIPSAMNLPVSDFARHWPDIEPMVQGSPFCVYCSGVECDESLLLAKDLIQLGHTNAFIFVGGFGAWKSAEKEIAFE